MTGLFETLQSSPFRGEILSIGSALVWAIAVLFYRISGRSVHPLGLNLFKSLLGAALVVLTMLIFGESLFPTKPWQDYALLGLSGFAGIALSDTFFFQCLNLLGASLTAVVDCLYSPFVILFSFLFLGERLSFKQFLGVALILSALLLVSVSREKDLPPRKNLLLGIGLGIVFRGHASTGGTDIVGMVVSKYTGISIGFGIMITDFIIISASGFAFRELEAPLYGYIVLFLSTKVIDMILEGWTYSKLVIITSTRTVEIEKFILDSLERSGTALKSRSLYLNREGEIILTVIHRKQLAELRDFIKEIDPQAFVIINDTYDVLGKGFKSTLFT